MDVQPILSEPTFLGCIDNQVCVSMERLKFLLGGEGDSTSTNNYYLNGVLVRPRYSHVTLVGGYHDPFFVN